MKILVAPLTKGVDPQLLLRIHTSDPTKVVIASYVITTTMYFFMRSMVTANPYHKVVGGGIPTQGCMRDTLPAKCNESQLPLHCHRQWMVGITGIPTTLLGIPLTPHTIVPKMHIRKRISTMTFTSDLGTSL